MSRAKIDLHDLMAVFPLVFRWELHVVSVQHGQELVVLRRRFEGFSLKVTSVSA